MELTATSDREPWHIPNDDRSEISLEHVLPEKPEGNWPQFSDDEVKLYYKRIGNLCLLRVTDNSEAKSAAFATKRPFYAKAHYELTKQVANATEWTVTKINKRQKALAEIAVQTWPI